MFFLCGGLWGGGGFRWRLDLRVFVWILFCVRILKKLFVYLFVCSVLLGVLGVLGCIFFYFYRCLFSCFKSTNSVLNPLAIEL